VKAKMTHQKKIVLIALLVCISLAFYFTQQSSYVSFAYFNEIKDQLLALAQRHPILAPMVYGIVYIIMTLISPSAALFSMIGGFLFGTLKATLFVVIAGTLSASLAFLATRYFIGNQIQQAYAHHLARFNKELVTYGMYYFIIIRIIPLLPFLLVNILAGLTRVPFMTFIWTTAFGIIPATLVYTFAGQELSAVRSPKEILTFKLFFAFCALALLALIPLLIQKLIGRKKES
jgi:uncharacterized membrane protein YdjX (TVP38/TMEM64 family)